ncbi:hypothetical protein TNCV_3486001 [Trichonephila clavipes]|nr:hypothetical protein TNCV_3486001 [Trichonephila clavipes]
MAAIMVKESRHPSDNRRSLSSKNCVVISDVERMGYNRNRWRDGQGRPDFGQGIMAPWARRPGCVLVCYAQIGLGWWRNFCDLPIRRDERRVVDPPLVFKRVFSGDEKTRERKPALDGEKGKSPVLDRGEPWLERTGRER